MLKMMLLFFSTAFSATFIMTIFDITSVEALSNSLGLSDGAQNALRLVTSRIQEVTSSIIDSTIYVANNIVGNAEIE